MPSILAQAKNNCKDNKPFNLLYLKNTIKNAQENKPNIKPANR